MSTVPQASANSLPASGWSWGAAPASAGGTERARAARRRGVVQGAIGVAVAVVVWLLWRTPFAYLIAGIAVALALLAAAAPLTVYAKISRTLEALGRLVATAVTWVLMALVFYLLFLPVGLVLRARRSLRLTKGFDAQAPSYWTRPAAHAGGPGRYQKQF